LEEGAHEAKTQICEGEEHLLSGIICLKGCQKSDMKVGGKLEMGQVTFVRIITIYGHTDRNK
jgi:hypothetical protein